MRERTRGDTSPEPLSRDAAERLFVSQLPFIRRVTTTVARQHRLSADDAEEFAAMVHLRLITDDYAVLRKFRGHSSLETYLTVVIHRICLDFRDAQWGKWRRSAAAQRHGAVAVLLERLTIRDGLTFEAACAVLELQHGGTLARDALARIAGLFPVRVKPRFVSEDELGDVPAPCSAPDRSLVDAEDAALVARATSMLVDAVGTLPTSDRLLLRLRFADGLTVASIARLLRLDQKRLYRCYDQVFARLRKHLETFGIVGRRVVPLLGAPSMDCAVARETCAATWSAQHPATQGQDAPFTTRCSIDRPSSVRRSRSVGRRVVGPRPQPEPVMGMAP